jgi:hypothetical protein
LDVQAVPVNLRFGKQHEASYSAIIIIKLNFCVQKSRHRQLSTRKFSILPQMGLDRPKMPENKPLDFLRSSGYRFEYRRCFLQAKD